MKFPLALSLIAFSSLMHPAAYAASAMEKVVALFDDKTIPLSERTVQEPDPSVEDSYEGSTTTSIKFEYADKTYSISSYWVEGVGYLEMELTYKGHTYTVLDRWTDEVLPDGVVDIVNEDGREIPTTLSMRENLSKPYQQAIKAMLAYYGKK